MGRKNIMFATGCFFKNQKYGVIRHFESMNSSCAYGRRLAWLILSFCFTGACVLADQASSTEQAQKDLSVCSAKVEQHRSRLKNSDDGIKRLATLDRYLETMKS